jgi:hypothetical protein
MLQTLVTTVAQRQRERKQMMKQKDPWFTSQPEKTFKMLKTLSNISETNIFKAK